MKSNLEDEFRDEFLNYASANRLLPVNNFTSALHLSMCAIDLKRGDKVLCSVNSSPEIPEVVRHFDAEPVFIDIELSSFKIDINKLENIINELQSKKLKAIILSHIAGELLDIQKISEIAKDKNLYIIEDATNSLGLNREELDSISDIKVFSFDNEFSNMGLFVAEDENLFNRAKLLSNHGIEFYEDSQLNYIYDVVDIGCQYRSSKIDLLFATNILKNLFDKLQRRREIAKMYIEALKNTPHIYVDDYNPNHSYTQFIIKVDKNRDGFAMELQDRGIETKLHYIPLNLLSYYKNKYDLKVNSYPNALKSYQQILSIPIHPFLTSDEVRFIIKSIQEVAEGRSH